MSWPSYLLTRALRAPDLDLGIVAASTPVVSFGDPVEASVATLGINPSGAEFLGPRGLLGGGERRLATLASLGVGGYDELTGDHAVAIVDDCASYFDRRPYRWFNLLDEVLRAGLGVSYRERSACHLDLVQWATTGPWGGLEADVQAELLRQDLGFLRQQLGQSQYRVVVVNGRSAMSGVERSRLVSWHAVCTLEGPPTAQFYVGQADDTRFVGWSCNLQSQHGAPQHVPRLAELVAEHVGALPQRAAPPPRGRRIAASPGQPTAGTPPVGQSGATSPRRPQATDGGGPMPKGLHFAHKSELESYLAAWLERSSHDTIGDVGTYGGSVWITVDSEAGPIGINRDTTRGAAEAMVSSARAPRGYDWLVVANRKGRVNRILFCEDRTPGWYAYLREPLDHETRLGQGTQRHTGPPRRPAGPVPGPAVVAPKATPGGQPPTAAPFRSALPGTPSGGPPSCSSPTPAGSASRPAPPCLGTSATMPESSSPAPGGFVDADGELRAGHLVFWGEWEAPSRIVHRWRTHATPTHGPARAVLGRPRHRRPPPEHRPLGIRRHLGVILPRLVGHRALVSHVYRRGMMLRATNSGLEPHAQPVRSLRGYWWFALRQDIV